jgi:transcriptional regulator with XRE-family HTH domain
MTVGEKLLELIQSRRVSISRAAEMVGMSRQLLWRMTRDDVPNPGILTVQKIVLALGGRMRDFFEDGPLEKGTKRGGKKNLVCDVFQAGFRAEDAGRHSGTGWD